MTLETSLFRPFVALAAAAAMLGSSLTGAGAAAYVLAEAETEPVPTAGEYMVAAADCYSIGQQVAAQNGGELAKANASNQGGQEVCVIVVLVPGKDGQRPRRVEVVVPAG